MFPNINLKLLVYLLFFLSSGTTIAPVAFISNSSSRNFFTDIHRNENSSSPASGFSEPHINNDKIADIDGEEKRPIHSSYILKNILPGMDPFDFDSISNFGKQTAGIGDVPPVVPCINDRHCKMICDRNFDFVRHLHQCSGTLCYCLQMPEDIPSLISLEK